MKDQRLQMMLRRVGFKLNFIYFLDHVANYLLLLSAVICALTAFSHLVLKKPFPLLPALIVSMVLLSTWAFLQMWRRRYGPMEVLAYLDSWSGGKGEVLAGKWPQMDQEKIVPKLKWRKFSSRCLPAVFIAVFAFQIPVLKTDAMQQFTWQNTERLHEKLDEIAELDLLPEEKEKELLLQIEQFQQIAQEMSTELFWQSHDMLDEKVEAALEETASNLQTASQTLQNIAANNGLGAEDGGAAAELSEAMKQNLEALANLLSKSATSEFLKDPQLKELLEQASKGNLDQLAKNLRAMSKEDLERLAEKLAQAGAKCQMAGKRKGNGSKSGLGSLSEMLNESALEAMRHASCSGGKCKGGSCTNGASCSGGGSCSGVGGVARGPGSNLRLFGDESPELAKLMKDTMIEGENGEDPGEFMEKTTIPSAPQVNKAEWSRPRENSSGLKIQEEEDSIRPEKIAPRYRESLRKYFSDSSE